MPRVALILLLVLTPTIGPSSAVEPEIASLILQITPAQQFAPGIVSYRIQILPHRDNFWFCMGWDNITTLKSRTSCQQLNGIYSPRVFYQEYKGLAEGCYRGFVDVYRTPNYRAATATHLFRIGDDPCASL